MVAVSSPQYPSNPTPHRLSVQCSARSRRQAGLRSLSIDHVNFVGLSQSSSCQSAVLESSHRRAVLGRVERDCACCGPSLGCRFSPVVPVVALRHRAVATSAAWRWGRLPLTPTQLVWASECIVRYVRVRATGGHPRNLVECS